MLCVAEVAERLGVHRNKVYRLIETGELHAYQLGGRRHTLRVDEHELDNWIYGEGDVA